MHVNRAKLTVSIFSLESIEEIGIGLFKWIVFAFYVLPVTECVFELELTFHGLFHIHPNILFGLVAG